MAYLATSFGVPQNPIHGQFRSLQGLGCGCGGGCGSGQTNYTLNGLRGLGFDDFSGNTGFEETFTSVTDWLQAPSPVLPAVANWLFYGGLAIAADFYFTSRGGRKRR